MAILREELYPLHSLVVSDECMKPFLWYKASVFLLSQVARMIYESFALSSMKHCGSFVYFILPIVRLSLFVIFEPLLSHLFIS